jgi:hypothetical protein
VRLSVSLINNGRYWKAGEEIPDEDVPPRIAKYAVNEGEEPSPPSVKKIKRLPLSLAQRVAREKARRGRQPL